MGLRKGDLTGLLYKIFEVDTYQSKLGKDENIITLSFSIKENSPAIDFANFIETGYDFVLDADPTPGEQPDGTYKVFIEIERDKYAPANIEKMLYGLTQVTGIKDFRFRYHKQFRSEEATLENLEETIPLDKNMYELKVAKSKADN